jgi:hypothetical protein
VARKKKKVETSLDEPVVEDVSEIGKSSNELPTEIHPAGIGSGESGATERKSRFDGLFREFTVFDAFLLISLICVTLATLQVFLAMGQYGGYFWDKPWNVTQ